VIAKFVMILITLIRYVVVMTLNWLNTMLNMPYPIYSYNEEIGNNANTECMISNYSLVKMIA